jgi:Pirin
MNPDDYRAGFPSHPHRGIETITHVLAGSVDHGHSLGNRGKLGADDVQWMTTGSGILHQEMPQGDPKGRMHGFQLWANLPSSLNMTAPRYQDTKAAEIPEIVDDDGTSIRVICGTFWGRRGPVEGVAGRPSGAPGQARVRARGYSTTAMAVAAPTAPTPKMPSFMSHSRCVVRRASGSPPPRQRPQMARRRSTPHARRGDRQRRRRRHRSETSRSAASWRRAVCVAAEAWPWSPRSRWRSACS